MQNWKNEKRSCQSNLLDLSFQNLTEKFRGSSTENGK